MTRVFLASPAKRRILQLIEEIWSLPLGLIKIFSDYLSFKIMFNVLFDKNVSIMHCINIIILFVIRLFFQSRQKNMRQEFHGHWFPLIFPHTQIIMHYLFSYYVTCIVSFLLWYVILTTSKGR